MVKRIKLTSTSDDTKLKAIINKQTIEENEAMRAHRAGKARSMYASDYGQCMKKTWFQFFPEDYPIEDFSPRTLRIFHNGEAVHERLSKYLSREEQLQFLEEVDVPRDDLEVHGRCDGLCFVAPNAVVVEFKSINRATVSAPKPEHLGQITWYMAMWHMLRQQLQENPPAHLEDHEKIVLSGPIKGEIIYESKQNQETYHFAVELNEDRYQKVRLWYKQLQWHIETKRLPIVNYEQNKFPCSWGRGSTQGACPYYAQCWGPSNVNDT